MERPRLKAGHSRSGPLGLEERSASRNFRLEVKKVQTLPQAKRSLNAAQELRKVLLQSRVLRDDHQPMYLGYVLAAEFI
jgi:hypothetical protein